MRQIRNFNGGELHIDYLDVVNYATVLNGRSFINSLYVRCSEGCSDLSLRVKGYYFAEADLTVPEGAPGELVEVEASMVMPMLDRLMTLSEAAFTEMVIDVLAGGELLSSLRLPITLQAWNHWTANRDCLEDIVSFVMPNHPYVTHIIEEATRHLKSRWRKNTFSGYNVEDFGDIVVQVRAIWEAATAEDLQYLTVPSNYVDTGQHVLTPGMIARSRHGNCLDLSLLLCSCFERIGLQPCLTFFHGHVVAGVWIHPNTFFSSAVTTASTEIEGFITADSPQLMVLESTAVCKGARFDETVNFTISFVEHNPIYFAIDVVNARRSGVRSLPLVEPDMARGMEDNDIKGCVEAQADSSRRKGWERKLLDLTLRNNMLNLHPGKTIVPIWERDTATVVSHIKDNTLAQLVGKPNKDNVEQLKDLYRAARTSLEENGANSLFVSLGSLRWFDVDDERPHIAPLLFIPVSIVRKRALTYEVRLRDDEAMVNVTLIEMLRQMFGVALTELEQLPLDADGFPNWQRVFDIFATHVEEINKRQPHNKQWELPIQSFLGIFSFTKFLMWHDVHYHTDVIDSHHLLNGLINNSYVPNCGAEAADARSIEDGAPTQLMLPIDYDSSQLEAVAECHAGQSFVLHGPPGTGKSQTITNMIADALYAGRRVLFVAEKKAALDVVRARLNSIGLGSYCLELHSNKTDKRSFFAQVQQSDITLLASHAPAELQPSNYSVAASTLYEAQRRLRDIAESIHSARGNNLSLYDCVNEQLLGAYNDLVLSYSEINNLTPSDLAELCTEFRSLDLVAQIMGYHPGTSALVGLYPRENTATNQQQVTQAITEMPAQIARARKKAASLINKWFKKKTALEILNGDEVWAKLHALAHVDESALGDIDNLEHWVQKWQSALGELRRWYHFSEKAAVISQYEVRRPFDYYLSGNTGTETAELLHSAYYRALACYAIDNDSSLRGFNGQMHEARVERYRALAEQYQQQRRQELTRKLRSDIVNANISPDEQRQLALLTRRLQTNGRGVAMRKIIADSGHVLGRLFPCMLMSPLSVAQYLDMKSGLFDVIIFDEASQMETPDAVGAIARGKSVVVVGDPKQLPPTRFFTTQMASGEEVEESEDSNSILEDCIALGMPSRYLSRHYRSRHESLIAFSNEHFYEGRLLTFPSHNDSERKVRIINPEGVYDYGRSRTNRVEAEAVVKHLLQLVDEAPQAPSIGVVAFSKAQSNLIEDILTSKLQRNKALQKKLDEAAEPLFIKNLENVQGDERDIIIFSIGYGPDKDGNVSLNFGPINQSGGERRLNVAVSRAREEMVVFSSLEVRHIPADGIASKGVLALRAFLAFAATGSMEHVEGRDVSGEQIIDDIAQQIRKHGYDVDVKVGRSSFKIDLAVVDAEAPERYRLGIIVDGRDYHNLPTVRDREITVPSMLRSLGWEVLRVWTIDWFERPDAVINQIIEALK